MRNYLDRMLLRIGFTHPEGRTLMRDQIIMALVTSLVALSLSELGEWGVAYACGALLITVNFWWLIRFAQGLLASAAGAVGGTFFRFFVRLSVTGAGLYAMIVAAQWPVWAILAGMSTVMVTILVWGAFRRSGANSVKEA
ncbi:MAG: ATP synthase subunit I [Acidobacteriota bacterium]